MSRTKIDLTNLDEALSQEPEDNAAKLEAQLQRAVEKRQAKAARKAAKKQDVVIVSIPVPTPAKMVVATLEEVAKVVRPHMPVVLPKELDNIGEDPMNAALLAAAELRQMGIEAEQEYVARLEVKRALEHDQRQFSAQYLALFGEHFEAWVNEPGFEFRRVLMESRESHAKKLRAWVAGVINKALAKKDEAAKQYVELEVQLEESRRWLQIHIADKDEKEFKAREELKKVGIRYEDVFPADKKATVRA